MIVSGAASQSLAAELAARLDEQLGVVETARFADGEFAVRVPDVGHRAVVVASTVSAEAHVELLQLQDAAREAGAREVVTVLPYMGYARQDEAFREGEPVSSRAVARAISTGTDRVITVNPHEEAVCSYFDVPATAVDAAPWLADPLPELDDPLFLGPDAGATGLARSVRDAYGRGDCDHLEKRRDRDTGEVSVVTAERSADDRDVVLVDDIVATGSTTSEAIAHLSGPRRVFVACVHPLLADNARTKLAAAGVERVIGTDTVERPVSEVSAASAVADAL